MMRRTPTLTHAAGWNDPFRLVLVCSIVALVAWVAVHAASQAPAPKRTRTGDVDPGQSGSILVSAGDTFSFDSPLEQLERDVAAATSEVRTSSGRAAAATGARSGSSTATAGSGGSARQPVTTGGGATRPTTDAGGSGPAPAPATGGTDQAPTGAAPSPGQSTTHDQPDHPGPPDHPVVTGPGATSGLPSVDLPLPARPVTSGGVAQDTPIVRSIVPSGTLVSRVVEPVGATVLEPVGGTIASLLG